MGRSKKNGTLQVCRLTAPHTARMPRPAIVPVTLNAVDDKIAALERELAALSSDDSDAEGPAASTLAWHDKKRRADDDDGEDDGKRSKKRKGGSGGGASASEAGPSTILGLNCELCGITVTSEELMREHLQGKKHKQAEKAKAARDEGRYCEVCALTFTGPEQLKEHCKGKKHRDKARSSAAAR